MEPSDVEELGESLIKRDVVPSCREKADTKKTGTTNAVPIK